jgi:parallel beta-helix repeat protein
MLQIIKTFILAQFLHNYRERKFTNLCIFVLSTILLQSQHTTQAFPQTIFYVSPSGNDSWSGKLRNPSKNLTDGPFATIDGARNALDILRKSRSISLTLPVIVYVHQGSYLLKKPILFEPKDSGTEKAPIIYSAFPGENPILTSGQRISNWKKVNATHPNINSLAKNKLWVANIPPKWRFNQLFLNGKRLVRSVTPNSIPWEQWFHMSSLQDARTIHFQPNLIHPISNLIDAEVNFLPSPSTHFMNFISPIELFDSKAGTIKVVTPSLLPATKGDSFRIENTIEGIDQPGEWSIDSQKGKVYLWPPKKSTLELSKFIDPNSVQILAPRLSQAILMQGDESQGKFVQNITVKGFTFKYFDRTRDDQPAPIGGHGSPDTHDSVITLTGTENISIKHNTMTNIGGSGIRSYLYAKRIKVENNRITNCGGNGIQFKGYPPRIKHVSLKHLIAQNYIFGCGQIYLHSSGIFTSMVGDTDIRKNHIENMPYSGIHVAGMFTEHFRYYQKNKGAGIKWDEIGTTPLIVENTKKFIPGSVKVESNIIKNVMQVMDDGGGIYVEGSHNNTIRNNFIQDCPRSYAFGIYLDMDELNTTVENNVVRNCPNVSTDIGASLLLHMNGKNKIQNNIFIARSSRIYRFLRNYGNQSVSSNLFFCEKTCAQGEVPETKKLGSQSDNSLTPYFGPSVMDYNLYWSSDKGISARKALAWMRLRGFENKSVAENPGFIGFDKQGRFHFNPLSLSIKFQPIKIDMKH